MTKKISKCIENLPVALFFSLFLLGCKEESLRSNNVSDFGASIAATEILKSQRFCFDAGFSDLDSCANFSDASTFRTQARIAISTQKDFMKNCVEIIGTFKCTEMLSNAYLFSKIDK